MPRPLRTSCDRCHSQKLKCPKQPGSATCTRCTKAGASCIFSPAGLSVRRTLATPVYEDEIAFPRDVDNFDMNLDWESMGLIEPLIASPPVQVTPPEEPSTQANDPRSICIQQLSTLAMEIDCVFGSIPPDPIIHMPKDHPNPDLMSYWSVKYSQRQSLEQLFASAQRLLDIYPITMDIIFRQSEVEDCHDSNCIHHEGIPHDLGQELGGITSESPPKISLDSFALNLLLTCHNRVMDVLGVLLSHIATCAKVTVALPNIHEAQLHIPELKVGNFVASPASSSSMQAVLLIHITSVLVERAKQLAERVTNTTKDTSFAKQARLFELQCEIMVENGESKLVALKKVRDALINLGIMK